MHEYANGGTLASTLAKSGLEQSTMTKLEAKKLSSHDGLQVRVNGFKVRVNDNDATLPNGDTVVTGAALLCDDRLESTNASIVDHLLDEDGVNHSNYLIDVGRFVTADARATMEDAGVMLFLKDASAKKRGVNTSFSSMEVSAASSLANEDFNVHDMRVPVTILSKDAPQLDKGKLR